MSKHIITLLIGTFMLVGSASAQNYDGQDYTLGGIKVTGAKYLDEDLLIAVTGLSVGNKVHLPGDEGIAKAIRQLWKQELFSNVQVLIDKTVGDKIFLNIVLEERPRLARYNFKGIKKGEQSELKDKINLIKARMVTEATKKEAIVRIKKYYVDKGFGGTTVKVYERPDTGSVNAVILTFDIDKGKKTHINQINISGNENASENRLKRTFKGTKQMPRFTLHPMDDVSVYDTNKNGIGNYYKGYNFLSLSKTLDALDPYVRLNIFSSSKFNSSKYEDDKQSLISYYNSIGYRDASIEKDTIHTVKNGNMNIDVKVKEGHRYYFGSFSWSGNTKYSDTVLNSILSIKKGDVYDQSLLDKRIGRQLSPEGGADITSLYMDDGYLFFNLDAVESSVNGDTINYEMHITEGAQARIGKVSIYGNDRTNDHVIRRELRTLPGNLFSRSDLIRSQREIANLSFFDAEKTNIQPKPHLENGTVDIDYTVTEKSSDQLQLSAGFGGGVKFYGNLGVTFNNFSLRNIFKPKFWDPVASGRWAKVIH